MNKKALALIMIGVVALPMAAAASTIQNHGVVTGHTTYANMGGFDPDVAAIAGLAESKVVWFNGQTIFSRLGSGFVYAVGSEVPCAPAEGENFEFKDYELSFIDPNNQSHIVAHYTYTCEADLFDLEAEEFVRQQVLSTSTAHHVWVTPTHAKLKDGPLIIEGDVACGVACDDGRWYNFALAVDTSKMDREEDSESHDGLGGRNTDMINNGNSYCEQEDDHVCNEGSVPGEDDAHTHNTATVDLFFLKLDLGVGAVSGNTTHPGTVAGCSADPYCNSVQTGSYQDPTAGSP